MRDDSTPKRPSDLAAGQADCIALYANAPLKQTFGMDLSYADDDGAVMTLPHNPGLEHALGDTHGGVLATMLDNAGWFTVAPHYDCWIATIELTVRLLEPAHRQDLAAHGRLVRAGKRLAVAEMQVHAGADRLVATGSGTFTVTAAPREAGFAHRHHAGPESGR